VISVSKRLEQLRRSILMLHEAFERLNASVLGGVELIAKPECQFNARVRRRVHVALLQIMTSGSLAQFEMADEPLARLTLVEIQRHAWS